MVVNRISWILQQMKTGETSHQIDNCLNCQKSVGEQDQFCPNCGQKVRESRISAWTLLSEFFSTILNLDSRFFKTIRHIFVPSFLPKEYMAGKRRSYINPSKFFFVTLIIHFTSLAILTKDQSISLDDDHHEQTIWRNAEHADLLVAFDSLTLLHPISDSTVRDSIRKKLFRPNEKTTRDSLNIMAFDFGNTKTPKKIAYADLYNSTGDDLIKKYNIEGYWKQLIFRQFQRWHQNQKAGFQFLMGNMLWVIVFTVIFSAFFLKLLYIRHKFYIVDHLVVSMFYHSIVLLILSSIYWIEHFFGEIEDTITPVTVLLLVIIPIYGFMTLKKYYLQGKRKTLLKFALMAFFELILLIIFLMIVLFISLMIF